MGESLTPLIPRLLLTATVALLFIVSWIVLPAPNRLLLNLAVGAPELSHWLVAIGVALGVATYLTRQPTATSRASMALAVAAALVAALPLAQAPFAIRRFNDQMRALGAGVLGGGTSQADASTRRTPVMFRDLWAGVTTGAARIARGLPVAAPGGVPLTLDVYRPAAPGRYRTVVQIYGGAWQRGQPGADATAATFLAARGFVVFAVDYRHAPRWQ